MRKQLQLEVCTKEKCKECDLVYLIKDYIKVLLQAFDNDLSEYSMALIVTKCLNSAVLVMYMYLGDQALKHTRFCDVTNVRNRYVDAPWSMSVEQFNGFKRRVLNQVTRYRYLYYIMITHATMKNANNSNKEQHFPGHVFVIEKIPSQSRSGKPKYSIYQAYINKYDLNGFYKKNHSSLGVSYEKMTNWVNELEHFFQAETWDERNIKFWESLTKINASEFVDSIKKDAILFCYKDVKITKCASTMKTLLKKKIQDIELNHNDKMNNIYNNVEPYYKKDKPYLTRDLLVQLKELYEKLLIKDI